jgi:hypothetical protein
MTHGSALLRAGALPALKWRTTRVSATAVARSDE